MQTQVKTYRGREAGAVRAFRADVPRMAQRGFVPVAQTWAPGGYGLFSFLFALLLCLIIIGFLIFLYMLIVKPAGTLTVTYSLQAGAAVADIGGEKACPRCAEHVKAAAAVCRFCGFTFPESAAPPIASTMPPQASRRPSSMAYEAGRSFADIWAKRWFRVVAYVFFALIVIDGVGNLLEKPSQAAGTQEASQVSGVAATMVAPEVSRCRLDRDKQIASYNVLLKEQKGAEAAGAIQHCSITLNDPELKRLAAAAYLGVIKSAKTAKVDKLRAIQSLEDVDPVGARPYVLQLPALATQISDENYRQGAAERRKHGVRIGMTEDEVRQSSWGKPESVNRTTMASGTHEQWVYGGGSYLYFEDGVLTSIQN